MVQRLEISLLHLDMWASHHWRAWRLSDLNQMLWVSERYHVPESFSWLTKAFMIYVCGSVIDRVGGPLLLSGQGLAIANSAMETMKIHEENQARLQAMSQSEILEEQRKLLAQLGELNTFLVFTQSEVYNVVLHSAGSTIQICYIVLYMVIFTL